ncbi:MAG: GatB/YqeY domain-containing protein [Deltaproteobacteria bacterium]|nr:MAG: GatB/YqeY domain-containing protein [Deltaproteobacteria bacterium]
MSNTSNAKYGWDNDMPMPLHEKIKQDLKVATLKKDHQVKSALRLIMAEYPSLTVPITLTSGKKTTRPKKSEEITNDDIFGIVQKLIKAEKTVLEVKKQESSDYLEILNFYLPRMATPEAIKAWIEDNVDFTVLKNPMQAMGPIMKHFGKLADGQLVKQILQDLNK